MQNTIHRLTIALVASIAFVSSIVTPAAIAAEATRTAIPAVVSPFYAGTYSVTVGSAALTVPLGLNECGFDCTVIVTPSSATSTLTSLSSGRLRGQMFTLAVTGSNTLVVPTSLGNVDFGDGGDASIVEGQSLSMVWDGTDWRRLTTPAAASSAELNILDGATLSVSELNILDGVTASAAELNLNDGQTATVAEINAHNDVSAKVVWRTDFLGDLYAAELLAGVGSGTGNAVALSAGQGGRLSITTASDEGATSANVSSIGLGALDWRADTGGQVVEARLQINDVSNVQVFVGFTDAAPSTVEAPISMTAADIDSDATDAAGILFDTDATSDFWTCGGVKAGTDTAPTQNAAAPSAATYYTLRVEISAAGAVTCYVDGVAVGAAVANAITATVATTPIVVAQNRTTAARVVLVDYLYAEATR